MNLFRTNNVSYDIAISGGTQIYYAGYYKGLRSRRPGYSEGVYFAYKLLYGACESLQDKPANIQHCAVISQYLCKLLNILSLCLQRVAPARRRSLDAKRDDVCRCRGDVIMKRIAPTDLMKSLALVVSIIL